MSEKRARTWTVLDHKNEDGSTIMAVSRDEDSFRFDPVYAECTTYRAIEANDKTLAAEEMFLKLEQMVMEIKALEGTCPIETFREAEALLAKAGKR